MTAPGDELEPLRARWRATLGNTIEAFRGLAARLASAPADGEALDTLRRELHRIRGTAGSFGFADVSDEAARLEARVLAWRDDAGLDAGERGRLVAALAASLERARAGGRGAEGGEPTQPLLVVEERPVLADALRTAAAVRGFRVAVATPGQLTGELVQGIAPHAVVVHGEVARKLIGTHALAGLPLVVVDPASADRAALVAAGAVLVDGPPQPAAIVAAAEEAVRRREWAGTTIVAVDDDPMVLLLLRHVLDTPTQRVVTVSDPREAIAALRSSAAGLLIADLSMPGLPGIDLVRMVRAEAAFADLPIVVLSAGTELDQRQAAHAAGANEVIPKPIAPAQLQARVAAQLEQLRLARLASLRHPVTGLAQGERAARDAEQAVEALHHERRAGVVAVLRPLALPRTEQATARWLREVSRVSASLPEARFAGHHEGLGLLLVLAGEVGEAADRLLALAAARPADYPGWRAGVVGTGEVAGDRFAPLRRAAEEAADVAVSAGEAGEVVHRWRPDEARIAPDVIVVEDDADLSAMLQYALRATGFSYRAFANGRQALDQLLAMRTQGTRPFVLLDVDLPGMDGYSLHERLAAERPNAFSVVFITVHAGESDQLRALRGGAVDYITKPLNLRILMAKMSAWRTHRQGPGEEPA